MEAHEWERLFAATRQTLQLWIDKLQAESDSGFPEKVTAFRKEMAVHGRYGQPCLRCGEKIQRIRYADKETNYCARCQTGGRVSSRIDRDLHENHLVPEPGGFDVALECDEGARHQRALVLAQGQERRQNDHLAP